MTSHINLQGKLFKNIDLSTGLKIRQIQISEQETLPLQKLSLSAFSDTAMNHREKSTYDKIEKTNKKYSTEDVEYTYSYDF